VGTVLSNNEGILKGNKMVKQRWTSGDGVASGEYRYTFRSITWRATVCYVVEDVVHDVTSAGTPCVCTHLKRAELSGVLGGHRGGLE